MEMGAILNRFFNSFVFWAAWIAIPLIMEIIPALGGFVVLLKIKRRRKTTPKLPPALYPEISVIIPIYNSADTLEACLRSFNDCTYPTKAIRIFLVNNMTRDNSFEVFTECQRMFPDLHMQWLNAHQGKSRALNLALYNSEGKYIVHIDSDGLLEPHALTNLVDLFESDLTCNCVTGTILTDPKKVEEYKGPGLLIRRLEFMEYANAFLAGRNYAGETNSIYTVSGAFSAFRKSAILKSWLYNTDTICEDTQLTFQMRYVHNEKIHICVDAIFLTDPIEDMDKLYTQRQRWQRGSLEVSKMFMGTDKLNPAKMFSDVNVKTLMYDHTFAFPRMIWYLATICMLFLGFSGKTILSATAVLFGLYTICGFLNFFASCFFLKPFEDLHGYYKKNWWVVPLLPFFNLMVFFIRLAGIINSIGTDSSWKTRTFTDERLAFRAVVKKDFAKLFAWRDKLHNMVNGDPEVMYAPKTWEQRLKRPVLSAILLALVALLSMVIIVGCVWGRLNYSVGLTEIVNTVFGPMAGAGSGILDDALKTCLPPLCAFAVALCILIVLSRRAGKRALAHRDPAERERRGRRVLRWRQVGVAAVVALLCSSLLVANACYDVVGYAASKFKRTSFYEEYYVDPLSVSITAQGKPKNLIYIYMESMEVTYASTQDGGFQPDNYIPHLTDLAAQHYNFSNTSALGGHFSSYGSTWTLGALFSTTSGVPYALPISDVEMGEQATYASGLVNLGDILASKGYQNEFLCGSESAFGGRKAYFQQHGDYQIFDYFTAVEKGYIAPDFYEWWGVPDRILYQIARDEATRMWNSGQPFNLTLLTVDTHAPEGHICTLCGDRYDRDAANIVACADQQVYEFITWCQRQPFYEDTAIVIVGDHPCMANSLVKGRTWDERRVYNCFINPADPQDAVVKERELTSFDMFPTALAAMGFDIQGDRLGLGTNLFSGQRTLAEAVGLKTIDDEISVRSDYYISHFAPELLGVEVTNEKLN